MSFASDWGDRTRIANEQRAALWRERGYLVNSQYMTASMMDAQVRQGQRNSVLESAL